MMSSLTSRRTVTYIVRVWAEYLNEQPPRWCGVIELVGNGERFHFSGINEMTDLIQQQTSDQIEKENKSRK
jgi:hypothetical protein